MFRSRSWFGGGLWKPKNPHSLEHLKYLYNVLSKNHTVSDNNRGLLVETLRSIAEILIWGDQNDGSVFDFFLEKNMLSFFLKIMKQKCGSYVCVQLLQTLNILFENIRNETSLYYLLSNNHVNSIIVHKFDFSDEEVMAYYISFLKTLSLKLNPHTIHFFYNEVNKHTNDFPLYTEAIKFFNHSEGMVRIAVRTLTLNVYRVDDASMLAFIRDRTAAPYFSNLVWFIGNHIIELDTCLRNDADFECTHLQKHSFENDTLKFLLLSTTSLFLIPNELVYLRRFPDSQYNSSASYAQDHQSQNRLADLVAEHLDHLHYLNDILCLNIKDLNKVLSEHLLQKLLVPLYVYSLTKPRSLLSENHQDERKHVSVVLSLFLLSQVFLIISHEPLVRTLATVILKSNSNIVRNGVSKVLEEYDPSTADTPVAFAPPTESLEKSLESLSGMADAQNSMMNDLATTSSTDSPPISSTRSDDVLTSVDSDALNIDGLEKKVEHLSITDEEKEQRLALEYSIPSKQSDDGISDELVISRPFLDTILNSLNCTENDYATLFSLCLLYALTSNQGVSHGTLDFVLTSAVKGTNNCWYHDTLVEKLIHIITMSCQTNAKVRLVTLEMTIKLLVKIVITDEQNLLSDAHLTSIGSAKEHSTALLRNFYKSEDIFLDMFEDEYNEVQKIPLNVEFLMMDSNILLPPTGTPMTGIEFRKRLPCGEVERARRAIRVFFLIRELSLTLNKDTETQLPLTNASDCVQVDTVLDLNNSDLIACTVVWKDGQKIRRFLVIDVIQLILVEPDARKLGWGVAKLVGFLQDIDVAGDKDDSRCLHLTIQRPTSNSSTNRLPLLCAKFIFDDHIRCIAAKQRLTKGRIKARQKKMSQIARLLDIPTNLPTCSTPPNYALLGLRHERIAGRGQRLRDQPRQMFVMNKVPGFAAQIRNDGQIRTSRRPGNTSMNDWQSQENHLRSRDNSPKMPRPRSEEIPLEDMRIRKSSLTFNGSAVSSLASTETQETPSLNLSSVNCEPSTTIIKRSEETSFTSPQNKQTKPRRKGQVETV